MQNAEKLVHDKLLSEEDSAELAGVSIDTIRRFRQFGLLSAASQDGAPQYLEQEITSLFHIDGAPVHVRAQTQQLEGQLSERAEPQLKVIPGGGTVLEFNQQTPTTEPTLENKDDNSPLTERAASAGRVGDAAFHPTAPSETSPSLVQTSTTDSERSWSSAVPEQHNAQVAFSDRELLEHNRMLQEQINSLKEERDWLRERLEKLETFSQREQMLLLSNSETIRTLLIQRERQQTPPEQPQLESSSSVRGLLVRALPWLRQKS